MSHRDASKTLRHAAARDHQSWASRPEPGGAAWVAIEFAWCPGCQDDRTLEVLTVPGDPGPVAVCVDCGLGVEVWWPHEETEPAAGGLAPALTSAGVHAS